MMAILTNVSCYLNDILICMPLIVSSVDHLFMCLLTIGMWDFFGRNDAEAETPVLWPPHVKSWLIGKDSCWEGLGAGEGDDRGWDGWMASPTWWTWVWVKCGSWWWTGRPGVLRFMGLQRVGHNWVTDLIWSECTCTDELICLTLSIRDENHQFWDSYY